MTDCSLCGLPADAAAVTDNDVDGVFCCQGCLEVHRSLDAIDDPEEVRAELQSDATAPGDSPAEETLADAETAYLHVDGMHCATCETFLESVARREEGVRDVRASYATDTVRVAYDADTVDPASLPGILSVAGYEASQRETRTPTSGDVEVVRFLIGGGFFGMMTMLWYAVFLYPTYFGYDPIVEFGSFDALYLFGHLWLFTSIVLFYTGFPILRGAYVSLRAGQPNMDLLVALAAVSAYLYSTLAIFAGRTDLYFDVTVAVVLVVTAGNHYETVIKRRATGLLSELTADRATTARRRDGEEVAIDAVAPDDELVVKAGERVPLDGTVVEGTAAVDEALVTGESLPETKRPGDRVRGGTVVTDAPLVVAVDEELTSTHDRLVELLWDVQSSRSGIQRLVDRLATVFVPLVVVLAVVAGIATFALGGSPTAAALVALTVVIVTCPCALGLATPLAVASGVRDAARQGIVITSDAVFEEARAIETVVFDKTGTLTDGTMAVDEVLTDGVDEADLLKRAAGPERATAHPVAEAIVEAAEQRGVLPDGGTTRGAEGTPESPGDSGADRPLAGVEVLDRGVRDGDLLVGHPELFMNWTFPDALRERATVIEESGRVAVVVGWEGRVRGVLGVGDRPRSGWENVVDNLEEGGRRVVVLTGDGPAATATFRAHSGVDEVYAGVPPEAKVETVRRLCSEGPVAMVGDGSNDAPALATADLGVALATGTDLAVDAADAVVIDGELSAVPALFDLTHGTNRRIRLNLGWAFCYNAIAIPLAVAGLLNPLFAAVAMATSSLLVVLNSSRPV